MSSTASRVLAALVVSSSLVAAQDGAFYDVPVLPGGFELPLPHLPTDYDDGPPGAPPVGTADFGALTASPTPAVRDVDGDGHLDVVRAYGGVAVWLGRGDGRFDPPLVAESALMTQPSQAVAGLWADVDGDGRLDVVFVPDARVEVLLDQGDGTFARLAAYTTDVLWDGAARTVGDYDGDGLADLVGTMSQGGDVLLARGLGDGTFAPSASLVASSDFAGGVAIGHLDDDGRVDVVTMSENFVLDEELRAYLQDAGGDLVLSAILSGGAVPNSPVATVLAIRDMDGDGAADVLMSTPTFDEVGAVAGFVRGDGLGGLGPGLIELPVHGANPVYVDVDGDGLVDVASRGVAPPGSVLVSFARSDGTLAPPVATKHRGDILGLGDFDEDGRLDAVGATAVWRGRGDGSFEVPRSGTLGADVGKARHVVVDDLDDDGRIDVVAAGSAFSEVPGTAVVRGAFGGGFDAPVQLGTEPVSAVAVADIDGDGIDDVASSRVFGADVYLFEGRADGSYGAAQVIQVNTFVGHSGLGWAQIGGSALPDLVLATGDLLVVRQNFGDFTFGPRIDTPLPGDPLDPWVLVHDVDGDGRDDVFVAQPEVYLFRTIGAAPFAAPVAIGGPTSSMRLADVDTDGDLDLLLTDDGDVVVHHALGGGAFGPGVVLVSTGGQATAADVADVDGDGLLDLAVARFERVALHLGVAPGAFAAAPVDVYDRPGGARALRFVDADADGRPDLLAVGAADNASPSLSTQRDGTWRDLGFALPGATAPSLFGKGDLSPGSALVVEVADVAPAAAVTLVAGFDQALLPFKGGVLVPGPALTVPGLGASSAGQVRLQTVWPSGVPAGTALVLQAWTPDAGAPVGWAASNALEGTARD